MVLLAAVLIFSSNYIYTVRFTWSGGIVVERSKRYLVNKYLIRNSSKVYRKNFIRISA